MQVIKRTEPWPHLFIERAFSGPEYADILDNLPDIKDFTTLATYKEHRRVYPLAQCESGSLLAGINNALTSEAFVKTVSELLDVNRPMYPKPALIYDLPGYSIKPHCDASFKVATMIIFLPEDDRQKMLGTHLLKREGGKITTRKQLGFFPNTGFAFKVTKTSLHDVPDTPPKSGIRRTLHICFFDTPGREFK
jgi:hypothetical protein